MHVETADWVLFLQSCLLVSVDLQWITVFDALLHKKHKLVVCFGLCVAALPDPSHTIYLLTLSLLLQCSPPLSLSLLPDYNTN